MVKHVDKTTSIHKVHTVEIAPLRGAVQVELIKLCLYESDMYGTVLVPPLQLTHLRGIWKGT